VDKSQHIVRLERDWDYAPRIRGAGEISRGHHAIRKKEESLLMDFFFRRTEGALLISGKRGVGKSSAVFSAINKVMAKQQKILPIVVNAPGFDIPQKKLEELRNEEILEKTTENNPGNQKAIAPIVSNKTTDENKSENQKTDQIDLLEFKRVVLQNLVRRLYKVAEQKEKNLGIVDEPEFEYCFEQISELYRRAVAKEVKEEFQKNATYRENRLLETESAISIETVPKFLGVAASFLAAGIISFNPIKEFGIGSQILAVLTAVVPTIALSLTWKRRKKDTHETEDTSDANSYYLNDFNVTNLQAELEEKLETLFSKGYKVIFIIDELDKIAENDIINVITSLKILFNQSSALYVLVIGEEYYKNMLTRGEKRLIEYTLFSQKIFLRRPLFTEMEEYIDNIIVKGDFVVLKDNEDYKKFRNYLCFASKTDFYDLYNVIRDHVIEYTEDGLPLLDTTLTDQKQVVEANLQKAMGQIYSRKVYGQPSDWYKNELLLDRLYELLKNLTNNKVGTFVECLSDNRIKFSRGEMQVNNEVERSAAIDLLDYLKALDYLSSDREPYRRDLYEIKGILTKVPSRPITLTKEEYDFTVQYERFLSVALVYANLYNRYVNPFFNTRLDSAEQFNLYGGEILKRLNEIGFHLSMPLDQLYDLVDKYERLMSRFKISAEKMKTHTEKGLKEDSREDLIRDLDLLSALRKAFLDNFIILVKRILEIQIERLVKENIRSIGPKVTSRSWKDVYSNMNLPVDLAPATGETFDVVSGYMNSWLLVFQNPPEAADRSIADLVGRDNQFFALKLLVDTGDGVNFKVIFENISNDEIRKRVSIFSESLSASKNTPLENRLLELPVPVDENLFIALLRSIARHFSLRDLRKILACRSKNRLSKTWSILLIQL
jgi:hypothetical protein